MAGPACRICDPSVVDLDVGAVEPDPAKPGQMRPVHKACCRARPAPRSTKPGAGYRPAVPPCPGFAVKKGRPSRHVARPPPLAGAVVVYDGPLPGGVGRLRITSAEPAAWRLRDRMAQALLDGKLRFGTLAPAGSEEVPA